MSNLLDFLKVNNVTGKKKKKTNLPLGDTITGWVYRKSGHWDNVSRITRVEPIFVPTHKVGAGAKSTQEIYYKIRKFFQHTEKFL